MTHDSIIITRICDKFQKGEVPGKGEKQTSTDKVTIDMSYDSVYRASQNDKTETFRNELCNSRTTSLWSLKVIPFER